MVIRLFITVICALGLALSPLATSEAVATSGAMPGCTMDGHMPAKPANHSKMDCCTVVCQMTTATLPSGLSADVGGLDFNGALHELPATKELASFTASGLDPPPRVPS